MINRGELHSHKTTTLRSSALCQSVNILSYKHPKEFYDLLFILDLANKPRMWDLQWLWKRKLLIDAYYKLILVHECCSKEQLQLLD